MTSQKLFNVCCLSIGVCIAPAALGADTHPEVQAALDYEIPTNTCTRPRSDIATRTITAPTQSAGSLNVFEGSNTGDVSDVDTNTRKRLERKEKRWKKCVAKYKQGLLDDMERLKASARHGLTQSQADAILSNMARIQDVYMTPDEELP